MRKQIQQQYSSSMFGSIFIQMTIITTTTKMIIHWLFLLMLLLSLSIQFFCPVSVVVVTSFEVMNVVVVVPTSLLFSQNRLSRFHHHHHQYEKAVVTLPILKQQKQQKRQQPLFLLFENKSASTSSGRKRRNIGFVRSSSVIPFSRIRDRTIFPKLYSTSNNNNNNNKNHQRFNIGYQIVQQQRQQQQQQLLQKRNSSTSISETEFVVVPLPLPIVTPNNVHVQDVSISNHDDHHHHLYESKKGNNGRMNATTTTITTTNRHRMDINSATTGSGMDNNTQQQKQEQQQQHFIGNNSGQTSVLNNTSTKTHPLFQNDSFLYPATQPNNDTNIAISNSVHNTNDDDCTKQQSTTTTNNNNNNNNKSTTSTFETTSNVMLPEFIVHDGEDLVEFDKYETAFFENTLHDDALEEENENKIQELYTCAIDFDSIERPYVSRMDSVSTFIEYMDNGEVVVPAGTIGRYKEALACILAEPIVEVAVCGFVIANCFSVALSTLPSMELYYEPLTYIENFFSAAFAIEFFSRWYSSSESKFKHIMNIQFTIDVVVVLIPFLFGIIPTIFLREVLPEWLISPSSLINLELLRILRFRYVLKDKTAFSKFEKALGFKKSVNSNDFTKVKDWQLQLARVLLSLFTLLSVASGMIYTAEHSVNPAFTDYFTTLYFGLTTLTTVGFGDITPITWEGRLVVSGSILAGVAVIPAQAAALIEALLARQESDKNKVIMQQQQQEQQQNILYEKGNNSSKQKRIVSTTTKCQTTNDRDGMILSRSTTQQLATNVSCTQCGAGLHWSNANYCWSCGASI